VELLVIHGISLPPGEFGSRAIDQLFTNCLDPAAHPAFRDLYQLRVSAHLLIRRDGELVQYVPLEQRAWHAGVSCYRDRPRCNDFSIGIELEGTDEAPYDDRQYTQLATVARAIQAVYPGITRDRIVGHCDIAPGRKSDPGPTFDWPRFHLLLEAG
jgi:AmpD protein